MSAVVSNDDAVYGKRTSCVWADEVTKFEDAHDCIVVERDLSIDPVVRVGSARLGLMCPRFSGLGLLDSVMLLR